jgi:hypothetical protein
MHIPLPRYERLEPALSEVERVRVKNHDLTLTLTLSRRGREYVGADGGMNV